MKLTSTLTKKLTSALTRALASTTEEEPGFDAAAAFFANGEQGVWYDASDLSTLFQDAGETIPVTAAGQPVVRMRDKSGNSNHLTLVDATLDITDGLYSIACNGSTTSGSTASVSFVASDAATIWAGVRKLSDAVTGAIVELSSNSSSAPGSFGAFGPLSAAGAGFAVRARGSVLATATFDARAAPRTTALTGEFDISTDTTRLRLDGAVVVDTVTDLGTGNFGNFPIYVARRGGSSLPFNGRIYSIIVRGVASSAGELAEGEAYTALKSGATLV